MRRITPHRSKQEDEFAKEDFDYVLTVRQREGELPGVSSARPRDCITDSTIRPAF
jgi:hypothetical protein